MSLQPAMLNTAILTGNRSAVTTAGVKGSNASSFFNILQNCVNCKRGAKTDSCKTDGMKKMAQTINDILSLIAADPHVRALTGKDDNIVEGLDAELVAEMFESMGHEVSMLSDRFILLDNETVIDMNCLKSRTFELADLELVLRELSLELEPENGTDGKSADSNTPHDLHIFEVSAESEPLKKLLLISKTEIRDKESRESDENGAQVGDQPRLFILTPLLSSGQGMDSKENEGIQAEKVKELINRLLGQIEQSQEKSGIVKNSSFTGKPDSFPKITNKEKINGKSSGKNTGASPDTDQSEETEKGKAGNTRETGKESPAKTVSVEKIVSAESIDHSSGPESMEPVAFAIARDSSSKAPVSHEMSHEKGLEEKLPKNHVITAASVSGELNITEKASSTETDLSLRHHLSGKTASHPSSLEKGKEKGQQSGSESSGKEDNKEKPGFKNNSIKRDAEKDSAFKSSNRMKEIPDKTGIDKSNPASDKKTSSTQTLEVSSKKPDRSSFEENKSGNNASVDSSGNADSTSIPTLSGSSGQVPQELFQMEKEQWFTQLPPKGIKGRDSGKLQDIMQKLQANPVQETESSLEPENINLSLPENARPEGKTMDIIINELKYMLAKGGARVIRMQVSGSNFGELSIKVRINNGKLEIEFKSKDAEVRQWLSESSSVFSRQMARSELQVVRYDVQEGQEENPDRQGGKQNGRRREQQKKDPEQGEEEDEDEQS